MKNVYIETFGCQMNKSDTEHMLGLLDEIGYQSTTAESDADLLILNTCAIRQAAEDKIFSYLGHYRKLKEKRPGTLIAIGGCVAQDAGSDILKRAPYVDIVFGTHNLHRLPDLVLESQSFNKTIVEIMPNLPEDLPEIPIIRQNKLSALVSVIYGCDYNCTYCIVPYVRGREKSRNIEQIIQEIKDLNEADFKEVTLLGQNVTAYGHDLKPQINLGHLIEAINQQTKISRLRFLTGHPRDLNDEIIAAVKNTPIACEYFHLPIQAGDDRTLRRMARGYNVDFYRHTIAKIRQQMPKASITTDLIVGFPGETENEFLNTVKLVYEMGFDSCNTAAYSPRPHTPAANWDGQISFEEKMERLRYLNNVVTEVSYSCNQAYLNTQTEILVEGPSTRNPLKLTGRTRTNKVVNFEGDQSLTGKLIDVFIDEIHPWALKGKVRVPVY